MVNRHNIQILLDHLQLGHVDSYMQARNWRIVDADQESVRTFEIEHEGEPRRLQLLRTEDRLRFRSKLQNLVFSLAVMRDEEPLAIANAMYDSPLPPAGSESSVQESGSLPASMPARTTLRNRFAQPVDVLFVGIWNEPVSLAAGDRWQLIVEPGLATPPEISFQEGQIQILVCDVSQARVFQAPPVAESSDGFEQVVHDELGGMETSDVLLAELAPAVGRIQFDLQDVQATAENQSFVVKSVAMLMAAIAQRLPSNDEAPRIFWKAGCRILAIHQTLVEIYPGAAEEFLAVAREDDEHAPRRTLEWLNAHTWTAATIR